MCTSSLLSFSHFHFVILLNFYIFSEKKTVHSAVAESCAAFQFRLTNVDDRNALNTLVAVSNSVYVCVWIRLLWYVKKNNCKVLFFAL